MDNGRTLTSGVAQGSLTGALFFIIYTNDLPTSINTEIVLYADDTTILLHGHEPQLTTDSEEAKQDASHWFARNHLIMNANKTAELDITTNRRDPRETKNVKFLGIQLDTRLTWLPHIEGLLPTLSSTIYAVKRIRDTINANAAKSVYYALFHSRASYGLTAWGASPHSQKVLILQKKAVRIIEGAHYTESCRPLFRKHRILTIRATYILQQVIRVKRHLANFQQRGAIHEYNTRQRSQLETPFGRLCTTDFMRDGLNLYNCLPDSWKDLNSRQLKRRLSRFLIEHPPYTRDEFVGAVQAED